MTRLHFDLDEIPPRTGVKWARYGPDVIPLWVADMDFPVAAPIVDALSSYVDDGDFGYTHPDEGLVAIAAAADWFAAAHRWRPPVEGAVVARDVMQGVAAGILAFTEPGDGVIVTTPIYPPFPAAIADAGRTMLANPLAVDGSLDLDQMAGLAPRASAILLCNPHNPSGRVLRRDELEAIAAIAADHDLTIISDEIHADLTYDGHPHVPTGSIDGAAERTMTLMAASKSFNMAGIGCGIAFFGSPSLRERFAAVPAAMIGHARAVSVRPSIAAWTHGHRWLDEVREELSENRLRVAGWAQGLGIGHRPPEGTYLAWLDLRRWEWDEEPAEVIRRRARVALSPGADFLAPGGFARLNFATSPDVLNEGLDRLTKFFVGMG